MAHATISRGGKTYVLVEEGEYERVFGAAAYLPPLPKPNADGTVDAIEYARASIAREVIARRQAAGMTQTELARAAGVRVETLNRIEHARHTADVATLAKLEAALDAARPPKDRQTLSGRSRSAAKKKGARVLTNTGTGKRSVRRDSKGGVTRRDEAGRSLDRTRPLRGTQKRTGQEK